MQAKEEMDTVKGQMDVDTRLDDALFDKPVPRHPKTAAQVAHIQAQNRRREYLERNPAYFDSLDHELADPLLYERLIKRFQTAAERQAEGKAKGYGRILEADLARGEQRLSQLAPGEDSSAPGGTVTTATATATDDYDDDDSPWHGEVVDGQHGRQLWREFLTERFVRGRDADFDYARVDGDVELDALAEGEAQDAWFDEEEPRWVTDEADAGDEQALTMRRGETGIQDF
ncbi:coiled-coil domain-containing protein [Hirsutella rhossiliensis]|uniref:Coiled-coil domain-containing protein n=1 Tax=Hirsutella rhossiliensis TaxID=111463 RepID=A0A9P8MPL6_9HYPO|nr:coiled-coil domain-containing protein [Hirsutella rhossiliensis]KAH0958905.1 coiled-coil domain-containing protein [Hirsutella rhossiliensis]